MAIERVPWTQYTERVEQHTSLTVLTNDGQYIAAKKDLDFVAAEKIATQFTKPDKILALPDFDIIIPMPSATNALPRGFAMRIAQIRYDSHIKIADKLDFDIIKMEKRAHTSEYDKLVNQPSFEISASIKKELQGKRVLIIDDVVSTGSSLANLVGLIDKNDAAIIGIQALSAAKFSTMLAPNDKLVDKYTASISSNDHKKIMGEIFGKDMEMSLLTNREMGGILRHKEMLLSQNRGMGR